MLDKLYAINHTYDRLYSRQDPFRLITRLAEECGELAKEVNHFEGTGRKIEKHGTPSRENLAGEIQDVLKCALQVAAYYGVEEELTSSVEAKYARFVAEGRITPAPHDR